MSLGQQHVREIIEHAFGHGDMEDACDRRDLGAIICILVSHGISLGQIASLTGITPGPLSEYKTGKRVPVALTTFEAFADGLSMPARPGAHWAWRRQQTKISESLDNGCQVHAKGVKCTKV